MALVADSGRPYTEGEAHDLLEVLRVATVTSTDGEYIWEDVRVCSTAHYTLTIRAWDRAQSLTDGLAGVR